MENKISENYLRNRKKTEKATYLTNPLVFN